MTRTYFRANNTVPSPDIKPLVATSFLFQLLQTIIAIPQINHGHSNPSRVYTWLPRSTTEPPTLLRLLKQILAAPCLSRPLRPSLTSLQSYSRPVKVSHVTQNIQDSLQDHRHCSKPTKNLPRVTLDPSKSLMILKTSRTHSRTTNTVLNQPRTFLVTPYLSQSVQTTNTIIHHIRTSMDQSKPPRPLQTNCDHYRTQKLFLAHTDLFQPHYEDFAFRIHKLEMNKDLAKLLCGLQ